MNDCVPIPAAIPKMIGRFIAKAALTASRGGRLGVVTTTMRR
ncbi:MAG: hypothetical protein ACK4FV_05830 [Candidatus Nitrosocaldus sp.]